MISRVFPECLCKTPKYHPIPQPDQGNIFRNIPAIHLANDGSIEMRYVAAEDLADIHPGQRMKIIFIILTQPFLQVGIPPFLHPVVWKSQLSKGIKCFLAEPTNRLRVIFEDLLTVLLKKTDHPFLCNYLFERCCHLTCPVSGPFYSNSFLIQS